MKCFVVILSVTIENPELEFIIGSSLLVGDLCYRMAALFNTTQRSSHGYFSTLTHGTESAGASDSA